MKIYSIFDVIFSSKNVGIYYRHINLDFYPTKDIKIIRICRNNVFLKCLSNKQDFKITGL